MAVCPVAHVRARQGAAAGARAHGQMGSFGPMASPLQVQCQSFPSEPGMSKPPEVVPKDFVFAEKHTQVLYIAQEPEAWNLQAAHAFAEDAKALSFSLSGSSSEGIGGSPNFPALEGSARRSSTRCASTEAAAARARIRQPAGRIAARAGGGLESWA